MGISISSPEYSAAAMSPLVLQLGPSESTRIFWNYESRINRGRECDYFPSRLARRDGETYPQGGVASGVCWVQGTELGSWTVVYTIICGDSKKASDSNVSKLTV